MAADRLFFLAAVSQGAPVLAASQSVTCLDHPSSLLRKSSPALSNSAAMLLWKFYLVQQEALLPLTLRTNCPASVRLSLSHDKSSDF